MPASPNVPNKVIIKSTNSNSIDMQKLRNIVKLMIVEDIKKEMKEQE